MVATCLRMAAFFGLLVLLAACVAGPQVDKQEAFAPVPPDERLYVVPFTTVMVPAEVREGIFDRFVDILNEQGRQLDYRFVILKQGLEGVDSDWLADKYYIAGEVFAYVEDSGCCATTIRVQSRLRVYQPDSAVPTLELNYPREVFFEHDYATVEAERTRLAADIAETLAGRLLETLRGS